MEKEGESRRPFPYVSCTDLWNRWHPVEAGLLSPDPPRQPNTFLIYWRKPEEWGSMIYDWVSLDQSSLTSIPSEVVIRLVTPCFLFILQVIENGMGGSIMTFYEITDGDMAHTTGKYQMAHPVLKVWKRDPGSSSRTLPLWFLPI
jgi:ESCRT-II complex subunit VPS25